MKDTIVDGIKYIPVFHGKYLYEDDRCKDCAAGVMENSTLPEEEIERRCNICRKLGACFDHKQSCHFVIGKDTGLDSVTTTNIQ